MKPWCNRIVVFLRRIFVVVRATLRRFSDEEGMHLAAGVAFYALLSLFPAALLLVSIFTYVFSAQQVTDGLIDFFGERAPVSPEFLKDTVESARSARGPIAVLGFAGMTLSSTLVFAAIMRSINRAWGLIGTGTRTFVRRKLWEFTFLAGVALLFFVSLAATTILESLKDAPFPGTDFRIDPDNAFLRFLLGVAPVGAITGILLLLYKFVPTTTVRWRDVWFPSLLGAVVLWIASDIMTWYIGSLGYYDAMYGSLATVIVLLLWIYVCANILIIGAALCKVLADLGRQPPAPESAPDTREGQPPAPESAP